MRKQMLVLAAVLATACSGPGLTGPGSARPTSLYYEALAVDTEKGNRCSASGTLGEVIPVTVIVAFDTLYWAEPVATTSSLEVDVLPFSGPVVRQDERE
ncbi:MAG: hypothetical protein JSV86_14335, partial [Gemmatimonadota bacterium]